MHLVHSLHGLTGMFKIGLQLYTAEGPSLVREIIAQGANVFLDLKFHDIPNTVRTAAVEAAKLGVSMMTIHTAGGRAMMEAVVKDLAAFGKKKPMVVGVTVLTSLTNAGLEETGIHTPMDEQVLRMARLAESCGLDGVVCSPREAVMLREACGRDFKLVTPGIRLEDSRADDQTRIATPGAAFRAGADYLVIGRPVTRASDPRATLEAVRASIGETA